MGDSLVHGDSADLDQLADALLRGAVSIGFTMSSTSTSDVVGPLTLPRGRTC